jgi:hypothetical protein
MATGRLGLLLLVPVIAGCPGADPEDRRSEDGSSKTAAIACPPGSEWPTTADAAWLRDALARGKFPILECSGSAYVIRLRNRRRVFVWAVGPTHGMRPLTEDSNWVRELGGLSVHGNDLRAAWITHGRYVWVEAGPTASELPAIPELAPLVAATAR